MKQQSTEGASQIPDRSDTAAVEAAVAVRLEDRLQRRNAVLYVSKWCLVYLAAPVLYVGFVQVGLIKRLGGSDFVANLPSSVFLLFAAFPIIMAWAVPQVRYLKLVMTIGFTITAVMGAVTAAVLWLPAPDSVRIFVLIAHGAVIAGSLGTAWAFEWEFLGRGIAESRRGRLFAWTFSIGPLFAVVGSLGAQLIINNEIFGWTPAFWTRISYPFSYVILYGATTPLMLMAALLVHHYVVPLPAVEAKREPFLNGLFGGFRQFISNRLILIGCIAYLLIYSGNMIQNNMVLYTREAIGLAEDTLVGYQLAIRFGSKVLAGVLLGWLLTRTNPRMNLFATAFLLFAGVTWILMAPVLGGGLIFLVAFGLNGAGELMGHYFPYYVLCLSPKSQMRRNMAFLMLLATPVSLAPALFGFISDTWNLRTSFWVSLVIVMSVVILVATALPAQPRPRPEDLESADLADTK